MSRRTETTWRWSSIVLLLLALLAMALASASWARGWLTGFILVSTIPIGSLALLMVHGITGGRWGSDMAPALVAAARTMPLLLAAFLPILILRGRLPHWPLEGAPPDVVRLYLNPALFDARSILAILIWTCFAWARIWRNQVASALGLIVHVILVSVIPADWILTLPPGASSAGFGLGFGIEQMFAALGFVAFLAPQGNDPRANRDLAGLIVTTLLGTVYFLYMQFLIDWYGNIPDKVKWYTARTAGEWPVLALLAFLLGAAIPFLAILNQEVRRNPALLRWVGGLILIGLALHIAWMTIPPAGLAVVVPAIVTVLVLAIFPLSMRRILPGMKRHA